MTGSLPLLPCHLPFELQRRQSPEAEHFLRLWRHQVPEIERVGLNVVEKAPPAGAAVSLPAPVTLPFTPGVGVAMAACLVGLVVVAVLAEAGQRTTSDPPSTGAGTIHYPAPLKDFERQLLVPDLRCALVTLLRPWPQVHPGCNVALMLAPSAVFLVGALGPLRGTPISSALNEDFADVFVGVAGLMFFLALLRATWACLVRGLILPELHHRLVAFVACDRQGQAVLSPRLLRLLGRLAADPQLRGRLLVGQSSSVLVDCGLRGTSGELRREAIRLLPVGPSGSPSPPAEANRTQCRVIATSHPACPRPVRLSLANDLDPLVRAAAIRQLIPVSAPELGLLIGSTWEDVRAFAAAQSAVPYDQLLHLAARDSVQRVRTVAQGNLQWLSTNEVIAMLGSKWADARGFAASQLAITRQQLVWLANRDNDERVRATAQARLCDSSADELQRLVGSPWPGARVFAVRQPALTRAQLRPLCADIDAEVARAAFARSRRRRQRQRVRDPQHQCRRLGGPGDAPSNSGPPHSTADRTARPAESLRG